MRGSSESRIWIRRAPWQVQLHRLSKRSPVADLSRTSLSCFKARVRRFTKRRSPGSSQIGLVYGCTCSRKDIGDVVSAQSGGLGGVYPGTCASGAAFGKPVRAHRVRVPDEQLGFVDRASGSFSHNLKHNVGDFIIRRADGLWAYQLAVVVDDAEQRISDVVRGADLLDNTPRQIFLQRALGLTTPSYLHVPLVFSAAGEKLSKQTGATAVDGQRPIQELQAAALHLGLGVINASSVNKFLSQAVEHWCDKKARS